MKISDYSVKLGGASAYRQTSRESMMISFWGKNGRTELSGKSLEKASKEPDNAQLMDSSEGYLKNLYEKETKGTSFATDKISESDNTIEKFRYRLVDYFLRWLLGEDYQKCDLYQLFHGNENSSQEFGGQMYYSAFFEESEATTFSSKGTVINSEGEEISFDMNFTLSRSFSTYISANRQFGAKLMDPLVINLDSQVTSIGTQSFYFDLNCDGIEEEVTNLGKGSAFLALDKNSDGEINDGSELFGALSGDGFSDLAKYDIDGNNWIDENDDIFDQLKIFSVDEKGNKTLLSLKDAGVGAIYLDSAKTDYHFTNTRADEANAYLRRTGVFLYENGKAGTIAQVDLAVKNEEKMV